MKKSLVFAGIATALLAASGAANALTITYDSVVTGTVPNSAGTWLTATITNFEDGVNIEFSSSLVSPEFVTSVFFSLNDTDFTFDEPNTDPDLDKNKCSGSDPAGTGPWDLCMSFDSSDKFPATGNPYTVFIGGLSESAFVFNESGYRSVAHVQGIDDSCSGWVGDNGTAPNGDGDGLCNPTEVPEPTSLALLGLGLAGLGLARRRRV